jgi:hypothetical protein
MNRNCTLATETKTETMAAKPPPWPVSSGRRFPLLTRAEDAGFEPARAVNPTRFPNPQTEVQTSTQVFIYARETIDRTLADADE